MFQFLNDTDLFSRTGVDILDVIKMDEYTKFGLVVFPAWRTSCRLFDYTCFVWFSELVIKLRPSSNGKMILENLCKNPVEQRKSQPTFRS